MGGYITPAQDASHRLTNFLAEEVKALLSDAPPYLYHYTSVSGMLGILRSGVLRAGSLHRMNDAAEVRFAASVFRACLDRRSARAKSSPPVELLTAMQARMMEPLSIPNVFSVSFSGEGDQQGMWSLYAERSRGFSFCIPIAHTLRWSHGYPFGWIWKCHYGEATLTDFCNRALAKAEELFERVTAERRNDPFEHSANSGKDGTTASDFATEYMNWLGPFAAAFKPAIWADEAEWRMVAIEQPDDPPQFIEFSLRDHDAEGKLAFAAVCAGPECREEDVQRVRRLLDEMHLSCCPVRRSVLTLEAQDTASSHR